MRPFLRRLAGPIPLVALGASAVSFWATGLWWLLPAGLAAGAVAAALRREEAPPPAAPRPAPPVRPQLRPLAEEKDRILAELARTGSDGVLDGADAAARVEGVVRAYDSLLGRLDEVRALLSERGLASVEESIADLKRQLDATADEEARQNLSAALRNRTDERDRLRELERTRERVASQLLSLASALTNLRVRLVQGRVSQDGALDPATGVREVLANLFEEVEVAEKTSRELNQLVTRRPQRTRREVSS